MPVLVLVGDVQPAGVCAGGDDERIGGVHGGIVRAVRTLDPQLVGARRQINAGDGLGDDFGAEAHGLGAHVVHELAAVDAVGETGVVLDVGGGGELAAGSSATGHHSFIENGMELGAAEVDGGSVGGRAGANDWSMGQREINNENERKEEVYDILTTCE